MKKEKIKTSKVKTLEVGDKIFYYDGLVNFHIEEVVEIKGEGAILSNNSMIELKPGVNGLFSRLNPTKSVLPKRDLFIKKLTPELEKLYKAIMCKKRINNYLFNLNMGVLKRADTTPWDRWSEAMQDNLINICGHIAKAAENDNLSEDEESNLDNILEDSFIPSKEYSKESSKNALEDTKIKKNKKKRR
jgi:hypothetical protein